MPKRFSQDHFSQLMLGMILLSAIVVRVLSLQGESFWLDEAYSFYQARNPFLMQADNLFGLRTVTQRLTFVRHILSDDIHPPFYYGQLGLWSLLGLGDRLMRMNSVLWGMLSIPAVYWLAKKFVSTAAIPLIAASLVAFSPFHVEMSIELRMYGLMCFLAAVSIYYLHTILHSPKPTWTTWIVYTLSNILMVYSQGIGFLWVLLQGLIFAGFTLHTWVQKRHLPLTLKSWMLSLGATVLVFLPWAALMLRGSRVRGSIDSIGLVTTYLRVPTLEDLLSVPGQLLFNNASSFSYPSPPLSTPPVVLGGLYAIALLLTAIGSFALRKRFADLLLLVIPSVGALLLFFVISVLVKPIFIVRALIFALPFFAILMAIGLVAIGHGVSHLLSRYPQPRLQTVGSQSLIAGLLIALMSLNFFAIHHGIVTPNRTQWQEASTVLAQQIQPDDTVIVPNSSAGEFLLYNSVPRTQYNGVLVEHLRLFWRDPASFKQSSGDYQTFLNATQLDFQKDAHLLLLTGNLDQLEQQRPPNSRVWLVTSPGRTGDELNQLLTNLQRTKSLKARYEFFRVTLLLYE